MELEDLAIEIERFISTAGVTHSDSVEILLERIYENIEEESK